MPELTCRRSTDAREEGWHVYYDDVLAVRSRSASATRMTKTRGNCIAVSIRAHTQANIRTEPPPASTKPAPIRSSRRFAMTTRLTLFLFSALLAGTAGAAAGDKTDVVRNLAGRVGPIVGSALACRDIARPRIQAIVDKFTAVIMEASSNEAERSDLTQAFDRSVADGRGAVTTGRTDCRSADRQLPDLERPIAGPGPGPSVAAVTAPSSAAAATAPTAPEPVAARSPVPGLTDQQIRL